MPYTKWLLSFSQSGNTYEGDTPEQVLSALSEVQFTPEAKQDIKTALAWRAWTLGYNIDETLDDEQFLIALHETGMAQVMVMRTGETQWQAY